jgi:hypothetical protein
MGRQALVNCGFLLRLLAKNGLTNDALDVGVRQLHAHRKSSLKPLEAGCRVQRGLSGANEEKSLIELCAAMLGDLLQVHGPLDLLADELLNLVYDEQGAG